MDEIFFVDLPTQSEREEIIKIHLQKKDRNPDNYNICKLAEKSKGFSGAELEEVVKEALFQAYDAAYYLQDPERNLQDEDMISAISKTFPLAKTMYEPINDMRQWAKSRAVAASKEPPEPFDEWQNDNTPKLQQESYANPFVKKGK
jgi:SpoVK/Ycf46/Vps4 family AAA+-type ATPase